MSYRKAVLKTRLELIAMFPFVLLGRLYGRLFPLATRHSAFLFFPSTDIGGATKVNLDVLGCIADSKPLVIFSKKPKNSGFAALFVMEGVRVLDLHRKVDNKLYHFVNFFYRGVLASWIDASENPVVFGGESLFFYKVIPHLKKSIPRIELCHLDTWLHYSIGLIDRITLRICSTMKLKETILAQYKTEGVEDKYYERLRFIENKIDIPEYEEIRNEKLEVVYIGRGAPQKRVHLIAAIAAKMHAMKLPVHFSFVGDVTAIIDPSDLPFCQFYGNVNDEALMQRIYRHSDTLILTSAYEGLPLVVMYMMAYGKTVLSTAVNGIPDYIRHGENGLLIYATEEGQIVDEGVELLRSLAADQALRVAMGKRGREIAIEKFGGEAFCAEYRKLLLG
ncbi:MAG TPA: glycosyltransferase family 4 protein [Puia sp.]|nr:glycosyltransferase family 4 protein [Puia sp.]